MSHPTAVHDRKSANSFVKWCIHEKVGPGYHPDTRFEDYVDSTNQRAFALDECALLNALQDRAFEFCDPYSVGLAELRRIRQIC